LYTKACDMGYAPGCYNLEFMYEFWEGVQQDKFKAVELYTKACDMKEKRGCKAYAELKEKILSNSF
jgi:hypothetical protein